MKNILIIVFIIAFSSIAIPQSVEIKDDDGNTLIQINDEGDLGGSITLPHSGDVSSSPEKLLNMFGDLYWNGTRLIVEGEVTTKYLSVPACAFVSYVNDGPNLYRDWRLESFPSGTRNLYAPVLLPHGATVTEFAATMMDASASYNVTIELARSRMSGASGPDNNIMADITTSGQSTWNTYIDNSINFATIDNSDYEYYLHLTWQAPSETYRIQIHSARIKYYE